MAHPVMPNPAPPNPAQPSPQLSRILAALRARSATRDTLSVAESRAAFEGLPRVCPLAEDVRVRAVAVAGVPCEWLWSGGTEAPEEARRALLFLHGGAYVLGSLATHRDLASRLGRAAGVPVLAVGYRLAPEHPFPAALEDACAVYRETVAAAGRRWAIAGDSAGGGLALATLLRAREAGLPLPAAVACLSPSVDLAGTAESMRTRAAADPVIQQRFLDLTAGLYLGGHDRRDPLASPLYADLGGLPPLFLQVGEAETLLDDSTRLASRARAAGVAVELAVWPRMFHGWQLYARLLPEGQQAIEELGEFLRRRLAGSAGERVGPPTGSPAGPRPA
jgi:epsilon-lactone hydrolase